MKTNILRYIMLLCLSVMVGASSCSDGNGEGEDPGKLQSLEISPSTVSLVVGQTRQLTATATPATASLTNLRWSSRDTSIAEVDENGLLTAHAAGTVTVTASCDGVTATREVTVTAAPVALTKITISPASVALSKGETVDLTISLTPENANIEGEIVWASSNPASATVDQNGKVTSVADGRTAITATADGITGTCQIEVYSDATSRQFTFFQLNIWEGLKNIDGGRQSLIDHLVQLKPDAASFCEFPSTNDAESILKAAADALYEKTGIPYFYTYKGGSGTRGLLTRHPVVSTDGVNNNSWFYRTVIDFYGQEIALYASHAFHSYYACYLPRGYGDGETPYGWDKMKDGPITNISFILEREGLSGRTQIAKDLVADSKEQQDLGRFCIFGGDLNQPSHLDWTEATKDSYEHNGCVVEWPISKHCYDNGMKDAFRTVYPNPVDYPGITWPVYLEGKTTTWAPEADDRDRIDYVYFRQETNFEVTKAQMVGPSATVSHSAKVEDQFKNKAEELIEPVNGVWPSDHRGLFVTFNVKF